MLHILEMADGVRVHLNERGWTSTERPALADVLNRIKAPHPGSDLAVLADTVGRRYGWTHFIHSHETGLNSGVVPIKTELPAGDDTISRKKPYTFK